MIRNTRSKNPNSAKRHSMFLPTSNELFILNNGNKSTSELTNTSASANTSEKSRKTKLKRSTVILDANMVRDYNMAIDALNGKPGETASTRSDSQTSIASSTNSLFSLSNSVSIHELLYEEFQEEDDEPKLIFSKKPSESKETSYNKCFFIFDEHGNLSQEPVKNVFEQELRTPASRTQLDFY